MSGMRKWAAALCGILLLLPAATPRGAGAGEAARRVSLLVVADIRVDNDGDASVTLRAESLESSGKTRRRIAIAASPDELLRDALGQDVARRMRNTKSGHGRRNEEVALTGEIKSFARDLRNREEIELDVDAGLVHEDNTLLIFAHSQPEARGTTNTFILKLHLPRDARNISYDQERRVVSYVAPSRRRPGGIPQPPAPPSPVVPPNPQGPKR